MTIWIAKDKKRMYEELAEVHSLDMSDYIRKIIEREVERVYLRETQKAG